MPAPDVTGYVDLAVYDREPLALVDRALLDAGAKLPGWVPREGNTEVVLIEAMALQVAELVYAINRLPAAVTTVLLRLFDLAPDPGAPATTTVTFHLADNLGHVIPAGTEVRVAMGGELDDVVFATNVNLNVAVGAVVGTVAATATTNGSSVNGTAAATPVELVSSVYFVDSAELATDVADGADPEDSAAFLDRGIQRLRRLVTTLVLPEHFTAAALEEPDVDRATTVDRYNPAVGPNPGDNQGHVTVAVLGANGATLSAPRKLAIEAAMEAIALAGLDVHVVDPTITRVDVASTVKVLAGYDGAVVAQAVEDAILAYLDPAAWEWGGTVRRNELIALVDGIPGVDYVVTLTLAVHLAGLGTADVALAGVAPLADTTAADVTITPT